jgi:hypothetical protein
MKLRGLTIAALVLAALSGTLYWSNHRKEADSAASAISSDATPPAPKILTLKEDDISEIHLRKNGNEEAALTKDQNGKWRITAPKPLGADQSAVSSLVITVASLGSDRVVAEKADDLRQYGLASASLEVVITTKDQKSRKVSIGDETPAGSGAFAMLAGDPRVFTIATYAKTSIDKGVNDLRDKRLITADLDKISQLELITKKEILAFGRNKQEWQILKPRPLRADNYQVEELVRKLREAKMDVSGSDAADEQKKAAAGFASAATLATVKVVDSSGMQELQVRKNKDDYYAKSSVVAGVYKVPSDLGPALDKHLDDFRNKKLFDFGFDEPSKVELRDGPKVYVFTKGGQDWWLDGKKMDSSNVQSLIDKMGELSASKFVDSGFTTAALDLTIVSNDSKRVEKVQIAKADNRYIAKRENEPALYEVDSAVVNDLQKLAGEVKPAPPAAPAKK